MELLASAHQAVDILAQAVNSMKIDKGIEAVMNVVRSANRYLEQTAPWTLAKQGNMERLVSVLYTTAEVLRIVSGLLMPLMPDKMAELRHVLGMSDEEVQQFDFASLRNMGALNPGSRMHDLTALFPRIQTEAAPAETLNKSKAKAGENSTASKKQKEKDIDIVPEGMIVIQDFMKVHLKTAKILEA